MWFSMSPALGVQFVGPAPRKLHSALDGVPDADSNKAMEIVFCGISALRLPPLWSCKLDLYAIEILACSWLTFLRLARRGEVACAQGQTVTDDICAGVYQWNSNLRIIGILGSGRERQHKRSFPDFAATLSCRGFLCS